MYKWFQETGALHKASLSVLGGNLFCTILKTIFSGDCEEIPKYEYYPLKAGVFF